MKNTILSFALCSWPPLFLGEIPATISEMTDKLTAKYNLTTQQQAGMLTIQERKLRNFSKSKV
ncbi:MAG: hypothetical protein R2788_21005 [Saprospiraceae bacterium]